MQPVSLISRVGDFTRQHQFDRERECGSYNDFANVIRDIRRKKKKLQGNSGNIKEADSNKNKCLQIVVNDSLDTQMDKLNYYNKNAKEIYFYEIFSTTDMEG